MILKMTKDQPDMLNVLLEILGKNLNVKIYKNKLVQYVT